MSEELNRRIALEVMGEPEPLPSRGNYTPTGDRTGILEIALRNVTHEGSTTWPKLRVYGHEARWHPADFSGDMDLATRAADKVLKAQPMHDRMRLDLSYFENLGLWDAIIVDTGERCQGNGDGATAPEAICRCLLAFVSQI